MRFCSRCRNLYYVRVNMTDHVPKPDDPDDKIASEVFERLPEEQGVSIDLSPKDSLVYYCRNCGHVDTAQKPDNICLTDSAVTEQKDQYKYMVNAYLKYDPTLPHATNIRCPNGECATTQPNSTTKSDVLFVRYDDQDLKYVYVCCVCDKTWINKS